MRVQVSRVKHSVTLLLLFAVPAGPGSALALAGDGEPRRIVAIPSEVSDGTDDLGSAIHVPTADSFPPHDRRLRWRCCGVVPRVAGPRTLGERPLPT